jgi:excisionase family DNA binding protein
MSNDKDNNVVGWDQEILLRGNDVARILNISRSKAYTLIQSGEIASVRLGGSVRVRPSDLLAFISERVSGGLGKRQ